MFESSINKLGNHLGHLDRASNVFMIHLSKDLEQNLSQKQSCHQGEHVLVRRCFAGQDRDLGLLTLLDKLSDGSRRILTVLCLLCRGLTLSCSRKVMLQNGIHHFLEIIRML
jgi:hypothetical protein